MAPPINVAFRWLACCSEQKPFQNFRLWSFEAFQIGIMISLTLYEDRVAIKCRLEGRKFSVNPKQLMSE